MPDSVPRQTVDLATAVDDDVDLFLDTADRAHNVRAVLVHQGGRPILERYVESEAGDYRDIRSVTRSVVSTLVGIAIDQGIIPGTGATLGELLPEYSDVMTPEVAAIPLESVLTGTAGFAQDDSDDELAFWTTADWVEAILTDRAARGAGDGSFRSSAAGAHILGAIVASTSGMPLLAFAREHLFDPLGIPSENAWEGGAIGDDPLAGVVDEYEAADFAWPRDPQGLSFGWSGLKLRAQDLARIGMLFLDEGVWDDEQIVSAAWITAATSPRVATGGRAVANYGFQWWVDPSHGLYCALGAGGTAVAVSPTQDLVVVVTSSIDPSDAQRLVMGMNEQRALLLAQVIAGRVE
ncbi:MAG: serine hydrolase [Microbacterium sp.]